MATAVVAHPIVPKPKRARRREKLDEAQVSRMAMLGLKQSEIAKHQGVDPSVVSRYLAERNISKQAIDTFRTVRADLFADLQATALKAQKAILDSLFDNGILRPLDAKVKGSMLQAINIVAGTMYDKERLETGKSTQNISTLTKILGVAFDNTHKPLIDHEVSSK